MSNFPFPRPCIVPTREEDFSYNDLRFWIEEGVAFNKVFRSKVPIKIDEYGSLNWYDDVDGKFYPYRSSIQRRYQVWETTKIILEK